MIRKITDFDCLSGVSSPLLPLIYTEGTFSRNDVDGAFVQESDNGDIKAAFSLKNTCVTLVLMNEADIPELSSFFEFCGVSAVTSDKPIVDFVKEQKELPFLIFNEEYHTERECLLLTQKSNLEEYEGVYALVSVNGGNFSNWFPEFSCKLNSNNAKASYIRADNKIVSTALATAIYGNTAVISGVFTQKEYRKKGYAGKCVKGLVNSLLSDGVNRIYLWCSEENVSFYNKIGFNVTDKIYIGECS